MTTSELISKLQSIDPTGYMEVSIGMESIVDVYATDMRDGYFFARVDIDPVDDVPEKITFIADGQRIVLESIQAASAVTDNPEIDIDYSNIEGEPSFRRHYDQFEHFRSLARSMRMPTTSGGYR